ncbi:MAG: Topoisomerase 1-associated factor 1 [Pycnora praestabilis]|nr:MAG: Topoisomerase 1-associated factor 1 [Pycnora praestabilis]
MEFSTPGQSVVDPEVRAYVYSLVSALGGTGADEDGRYVLGDDALACLKDLKRWLKLHDEKANRLDVARCMAEANLVNGDILEILAAWPEEATEDKIKSKIALACLELLVPLTWPIEKNEFEMTVNHHRHTPYLQLAQASYKRGILNYDTTKIMRAIVRIGLPSMAQLMNERSTRDEGIIKLVLYFLRNVAIITPPQNLPMEGADDEISRSATIEAFEQQDIFHLLLTLSSSIGEDFNTQDVIVLEILFHLLKGVDLEKLFMDDIQLDSKKTDELKDLLSKEAGMKKGYARNAPTRHNRFGTMIWIKRDDDRMSTVSGQDALMDSQRSLATMDKTKKWNKPKHRSKNSDSTQNDFDMPVHLNISANKHLRKFVEEFLDSAFNPLFNHLRKAIEREAERVLDIHSRQYFFLVSWFLEAECVRRKSAKNRTQPKKQTENVEIDGFALVAAVLNQETFIALNKFMQETYDTKQWHDLNAGMRCFTQILLTVQEMSESALEEDQEIAENIQNRIFYEESTHDRIIGILRGYSDQGFGYLDACTELAHVFLRMLERYSKQNVDLQVRSKRRARRKKKAQEKPAEGSQDDNQDEGSEMEDVAQAQRASSERRFDFTRFSAKFITQKCVDTFVAFTKFYNELDTEQLKRAHRFFYRLAFKAEMSVLLFRVDIIALFYKMVKGPEGLDFAGPAYHEWDELVRQLIKRMVKKMEQRPELAVEMLFSKMNATVHYLEYGYEKQTMKSIPKAPAELSVKSIVKGIDEQIGVVVAILSVEGKHDAVNWILGVLFSAASERKSWEGEAVALRAIERQKSHIATEKSKEEPEAVSKAPSIVVTPDSESRRIAMFRDNKLRLLMTLVGFQRPGLKDYPQLPWTIPSSITAEELEQTHQTIEAKLRDPTFMYGENYDIHCSDLLRRTSAGNTRRAAFDDDSDGDGLISNDEEDFFFPAGGPTNRKSQALEDLKKKRRRRYRDAGDEEDPQELDEETREARRVAREKTEKEKMRKIKSDLYVHDSDDEDDAERDIDFFNMEEQRRKGQSKKVLEALSSRRMEGDDVSEGEVYGTVLDGRRRKRVDTGKEKPKRRKISAMLSDSDDEMHSDHGSSSPLLQVYTTRDSGDEATDTPLSSPTLLSSQDDSTKMHPSTEILELEGTKGDVSLLSLDANEEEEDIPITNVPRRRARFGFIVDSDSE